MIWLYVVIIIHNVPEFSLQARYVKKEKTAKINPKGPVRTPLNCTSSSVQLCFLCPLAVVMGAPKNQFLPLLLDPANELAAVYSHLHE